MNETVTRAGKATSEFWLLIAFFVVVVVNGTDFVNIPVEQVTMLAAGAFGYTGGRTFLKNSIAKGVTP